MHFYRLRHRRGTHQCGVQPWWGEGARDRHEAVFDRQRECIDTGVQQQRIFLLCVYGEEDKMEGRKNGRENGRKERRKNEKKN